MLWHFCQPKKRLGHFRLCTFHATLVTEHATLLSKLSCKRWKALLGVQVIFTQRACGAQTEKNVSPIENINALCSISGKKKCNLRSKEERIAHADHHL